MFSPYLKLCAVAGLCIGHSLSAVVIVSDSFNEANRNLSGSAPDVGPANWSGSADYKISGNVVRPNTGLTDTSSGQFSAIFLGSSYFANNPDVYELTAVMNFDTSSITNTGAYISIGFTNANNSSYRVNRTHLSNDSLYFGAPSIAFRGNGEVLVNTQASGIQYQSGSGAYAEDVDHIVKLVFDTTQTNWTVAAYVDGVQLDLDSGSASLLYTYATNPNSQYLSISSNVGVGDSAFFYLDDVQLQTITVPEPSTYGMIFGALVGAVVWMRRRSR